jgi:hypothetical protein
MSGERVANYHPVKFLDELEGNNHIVLLYDDETYGDMMIARYFQNGLNQGQSCIYFTDEAPDFVEVKLHAQGLDVEKYKRSNKLRVVQTQPPPKSADVDVLEILKTIRREFTRGMTGPFRFAGRTIMDIESVSGMRQGMEVERTGQEHFPEFDNAQMCFYDIRKLERSRRDEWIAGLLMNHNQVIYASAPDKAVAFETTLLEEEDEEE